MMKRAQKQPKQEAKNSLSFGTNTYVCTTILHLSFVGLANVLV